MYTRIRLTGQNWYTHNPKDCTIGKSCDMLLCEQSEGWKKLFYNKISNLFDRQGKSKNHVVSTNFKYLLCPIQEKRQRIPIHIQDKVQAELNKLLSEGHIEKLDKCTSDCFIAPIVITVKKYDSIKLALDAKPTLKTNIKCQTLMNFLMASASLLLRIQ